MKIAIIGAGNSGCAQASKLVQNGHTVNLIKTSNSIHNDNFERLLETKCIECIDSTDGDRRFKAPLNLVTRNIEEGICNVDAILVLTQSLQHRSLAPIISPYFEDGQIVLIIPGNMGSTQFAKYTKKHIIFAEGESTPYDARIVSPGVVTILFRNVRNAVSFLNKEDEIYLNRIDELFNAHKYLRANIVESTLHNPNMIVHTIGCIMSASRIEYTKGNFWMYREAFTPSIWNIIKDLDKEKMSVIKAYGGKNVISYLDACKWRNEVDLSKDSHEVFDNYARSGGPKGPYSLDSRYINEDVPMELCLMETLGKMKKIPTPIASSLITIASSLKKVDFRKIAYSFDEISEFIQREHLII